MLLPFFTFYGGKWRSAPHYPPPVFNTIVEPFAGSAGFSVRYPQCGVTLVDADAAIVETWRYLIRVSPAEILRLPDVFNGQTVDDLSVAPEARLLIGWWLNKGASTPCKTPSAWMRLGTHATSYWGESIRNRIASQVEQIRHWKVVQGTYADAPPSRATWFIDPPYEKAGRHYRCGSNAIDYGALGEWCRSRDGQVIVCENEGAAWLPFSTFRGTKASPAKHGGKVSHEVVWLNHTPAGEGVVGRP